MASDGIKTIKADRRGGKRPNAGRKPGSKSRTTPTKARVQAVNDVIVARVAGEKLDPVEAIMETVEWAVTHWRAAAETSQHDNAKEWAALVAEWGGKAAPYIRPRLAAVEARIKVNVTIYERIERANQRLIAV